MAIKSVLSVLLNLFLLLLQFIEWVVEVYWYYDWQLFRYWNPFSILPMKLRLLLPYCAVLGFLIAAVSSDFRHQRSYHWSHWLVLASLFVSSLALLVYYHSAL